MESSRQGVLAASAQIVKDFSPQLYASIATRSEFEIWWGLPPAPINCKRNDDPCAGRYSILGRLLAAMNLKILPLNLHFGSEYVEIPYSPLVYANEVMDGNLRSSLDPVLRSKFLFYGSDLDILRDNYRNPVYSYRSHDRMLPGIFFHAMALENLIDLQTRIKTPRSADLAVMWRRDVASIAIICICVFIFRTVKGAASNVGDVLVIIIAAIGIAATEFFYFNLAPSNWIGVFSCVTLAHVTHADEGFRKLARLAASGRAKPRK